MKLQIISIFLTIAYVNAIDPYSDVCYPGLDCFTTRPPFSTTLARPIALLPSKPEEIDTMFYLYSKDNRISPSTLNHKVPNQKFVKSNPTVFIIHGFLQNHDKQHILNLKDALLELSDFNVISVDWSNGSRFPYTRATANAQVVGAEIARLINVLVQNYSVDINEIHLIGHNLGAHIAGYAGDRVKGLGRITGLDPAGPYFENTDPKVRLDETDAKFVDVIHTDGDGLHKLGLGLMQRSGHVDFYPNGGKNQPKCPETSSKLLNGIFSLVSISSIDAGLACNTLASVKFFTDSIRNSECKYIAYQCKNYEQFSFGNCIRCSALGCNEMGYLASPNFDTGMLFLSTDAVDKYPYCQHDYSVSLKSSSIEGQLQTRGVFKIQLQGEVDNSSMVIFDNEKNTFKADSIETRLISTPKFLGETIIGAKVEFKKISSIFTSWLYQNEWSFSNIEINYGNRQKFIRLCPEPGKLKSGGSLQFYACE